MQLGKLERKVKTNGFSGDPRLDAIHLICFFNGCRFGYNFWHPTAQCHDLDNPRNKATELLEAVKMNELLQVEVTWPVFGMCRESSLSDLCFVKTQKDRI